MTQEEAKKLRKGREVFYAGAFYKVALVKPFPHGVMIGIYDEPPSTHVDYLQPKNVQSVFPCFNCQGIGCPTCSGYGRMVEL